MDAIIKHNSIDGVRNLKNNFMTYLQLIFHHYCTLVSFTAEQNVWDMFDINFWQTEYLQM